MNVKFHRFERQGRNDKDERRREREGGGERQREQEGEREIQIERRRERATGCLSFVLQVTSVLDNQFFPSEELFFIFFSPLSPSLFILILSSFSLLLLFDSHFPFIVPLPLYFPSPSSYPIPLLKQSFPVLAFQSYSLILILISPFTPPHVCSSLVAFDQI